jgi:hypothetical protein
MAEVPYGLPSTGAHATSSPLATGSGSTITNPLGAHACFITVATQNAYLTLDGTTPSATNGLTLVAGGQPFFLPCGRPLTVLSATAGAVINVLWLA